MKPDRRPATIIICLLLVGLAIAQGSDRRTTISKARRVSLPGSGLNGHSQPLIAPSGKVGFTTSATGGSLISFSVTSGKVLSTASVGQTLGLISMIEAGGRRLIAVPAVNDPKAGNPATIAIVDATSAKRLDFRALLMLPPDAGITASTAATLTRDGRFCVIASSFDVPTLFSFDIESGELVSHLALIGKPSEIAFFEGKETLLAVASASSNNLSVVKVDDHGQLTSASNFNPSIARIGEDNNPAFGSDGKLLYIAGYTGERLFALDSESGIIIDSIPIGSPGRISVASAANGVELIGVTRTGQSGTNKAGATIVANLNGRLTAHSEFNPPDGIDFSGDNNVAFNGDASVAFLGSTTGILFAFNTASGDLESYHQAGGALRRVSLSERTRSVAAVQSAAAGDELTIISFDVVGPDGVDPTAPAIELLSPQFVEQGRSKNLKVVIAGKNLSDGDSLVVNGVEMGAELVRGGRALETNLPKTMFGDLSSIKIQVKSAGGTLSQPTELKVVRPDAPTIDRISPAEVAGPSTPFTLHVTGKNFRASSALVVGGHPLNTRLIATNELEAVVPAEISGEVKSDSIKVQVRDLAVPDLASANQGVLKIFGPRVDSLRPLVGRVVAGGKSFGLRIVGENFREGAQVDLRLNDQLFTVVDSRRVSSKLINLNVPTHVIEESGDLAVIVRNPEGAQSQPQFLSIRAPEITGFGKSRVYAGSSDITIEVLGKNFRRNARVYVGNTQVAKQQVRFRNSSHLTVTLSGELNKLLEKPNSLRFQIVNPNAADGVPSTDKAISVVGPQVKDAVIEPGDDPSQTFVVISGANFRRGATVEIFKDGIESAPVMQRRPIAIAGDKITILVDGKKLDRIGNFRMRVVNSGTVPVVSGFFRPRQELATRDQN